MYIFSLFLSIVFDISLIACGGKSKYDNGRGKVYKTFVDIDYSKCQSLSDYNVDDLVYLKSVMIIYHDIINGRNKNFDIKGISDNLINCIKRELLSLLVIPDNKPIKGKSEADNVMFVDLVNKVFVKINAFIDSLYKSEGCKDQLFLCFLLKRIYSIFKNVCTKTDKYSSNSIASILSYDKLVSTYSGSCYRIIRDKRIESSYIPNFSDSVLINSISDVINYIKSCFFVYSIFIGNKIFEVFPMLSVGKMKINPIFVTIFDNETTCHNVSFFFEKMERKNNNSETAFVYRQILNSSLESNNKLYTELLKINGSVFIKDYDKCDYQISIGDSNMAESYVNFFENIKNIKSNKMYKSILKVYKTTVKLPTYFEKSTKKNEISVLNILKDRIDVKEVVSFKECHSKLIEPGCIKYILGV